MRNAIFLTHKNTLGFQNSITGGVQLCSQEYFRLLESAKFKIEPYYVNYTRKIIDRLLIKLNLDSYNSFNVKKDQQALISHIKKNNVEYVFINLASLLRYSQPIKEYFKDEVKVFLLSHGNDSGDFLHLTTKPLTKYNFITKMRDLFRLGRLIYTESLFRNKYLDGVFTVSQVEEQIENWLGSKKVVFVPRSINTSYTLQLKTNYKKAGFIGRLDHPPNRQGLEMLCMAIDKESNKIDFQLSLIGAPNELGEYFQRKYSFISYKGELLDNQLEVETATWALFLNPVFWYSMGVTTKVAKAIEWGIPVLTTHFGLRGYQWSVGQMLIVNNEIEMAQTIITYLNNPHLIDSLKNEMENIKKSSATLSDLALKITIHLASNQ